VFLDEEAKMEEVKRKLAIYQEMLAKKQADGEPMTKPREMKIPQLRLSSRSSFPIPLVTLKEHSRQPWMNKKSAASRMAPFCRVLQAT
jgi:hypothetical protein